GSRPQVRDHAARRDSGARRVRAQVKPRPAARSLAPALPVQGGSRRIDPLSILCRARRRGGNRNPKGGPLTESMEEGSAGTPFEADARLQDASRLTEEERWGEAFVLLQAMETDYPEDAMLMAMLGTVAG